MNTETNMNPYLSLDENISLAQELNITANEAALTSQAEACLLSTEAKQESAEPSPEEQLVQAIILQAVEDWRLAVEQLRLTPGNSIALAMKRDAEAFFLSRWFRMLIDLDGAELLERLRQSQGWTDTFPAQDTAAHRLDRFRRSMNYKSNSKGRKQAG